MKEFNYRTIEEAWQQFSAHILDNINASDIQRVETRRAFYAGANAMFELVNESSDLPMGAACKKMDEFVGEFERYAEDLRAGRA